jgi:OmpA-OmpF porin, OOP family
MNMKKKVIAVSLLCAAASQTAAAGEVGFYIGAYFGQASKDISRNFFEDFKNDIHAFLGYTPAEETITFDDSDSSYSLFAGYRLNTYLAFEGGYSRLGQVTYHSRSTGTFPMDTGFVNTTFESETSGFTLSVLGTLPLTRDWELYGRGGVLFATNRLALSIRTHQEVFVSSLGTEFSDSFSKGSTDTYAALGISRRFFENYTVRLEYQRAFDAGLEDTGGQGDLDAALLGLTVTF